MKGKFVLTASLATLLGLGVSVGVHHAEFKEANAWSGAECGKVWYIVGTVNGQNWDHWNLLELKGDRYEYTFEDASSVEFKLRNAASWESGIEIHAKYGSDLNWDGAGWSSYTEKADDSEKPNFKTKEAGKYTVYFDKNIESYENGVWAFGIEKVSASTQYTVTTHVKPLQGETVVTEGVKVDEGKLPAAPELEFGEEFSGWFKDDGYNTPATGVTADCDLYGMINEADKVTYGVASHAFTPTHVYAFNASGHNAEWPGEEISENSITLPKDAKFILNEGAGEGKKQTVDINPGDAGDTVVIVKKQATEGEDTGKYYAGFAAANDIPLQEGHYVVNSTNEYKYADAPKMVTYGEPDERGNIAVLEELTVVSEEGIHVRSYFNGEDTWFYGNDQDKDYGVLDGDKNFVFSKGGKFSVYAKWEEAWNEEQQKNVSTPRFYTSPKYDTYDVTVKNVILGVRGLENQVVNGETQYAVVGSDFDPAFPKVEGYAVYEKKAYLDEACTQEYVKKASEENLTIYIKYIEEGVYIVGDENFVGTGNPEWSPLGGFKLTDEVQDPANMFEGSVTVPTLEAEQVAKAKPFMVDGDAENVGNYVESVLGTAYDFVTQEETGEKNYVVSKGGTYGVFVKMEEEVLKVYFNAGLGAFCTKFLSQVGDTCDADGKTVVANLQLVWADQKAAYESLTADEQKVLKDIGFDGGKEDGTNEEKVIAKYAYIVTKYGTAKFVDFIWSQNIAGKAVINEPTVRMNNTMTLVIIISAGVLTTISLGLLFVLKKKRFNNK